MGVKNLEHPRDVKEDSFSKKMVSGVGEPNTPGRREKKVIKEQKTKANGSMNIVQENYRLGQTLVINRR